MNKSLLVKNIVDDFLTKKEGKSILKNIEKKNLVNEEIEEQTLVRKPAIKATVNNEGLGNELREQEYAIILETVIECNGKRKEIADRLGISPRTLRYKLAKMRDAGIEIPI